MRGSNPLRPLNARSHRPLIALLIACGLAGVPTGEARAITVVDGLDIKLQLRTRLNRHDGKDGLADNPDVLFFDNRARLTVDGRLDFGLRAFVQLQDVRVWGEEDHTLFEAHAEGFDVHQAWADIPLVLDGLDLRIGRQEMVIDEQRLVGAVGWTAQARSFDAVKLSYKWADDSFGLYAEAFYAQTSDKETILPTTANPEDAEKDTSGLAGTVVKLEAPKTELFENTVTLLGLIDYSKGADRMRYTLGLYDKGSISIFDYRVEAYFQGGDLAGDAISAFMFGGYAGVTFGTKPVVQIRLWADVLSGSSHPDDSALEAFDTLFATNHAFYGHADFFLNPPAHTQGKGLVDLALKTSVKPLPSLAFALDLHHFRAAVPRGEDASYGFEIDFTAKWKPWKQATLFLGVYSFFPEHGLDFRLQGIDPDVGVYTFAQVDI